MVITSLIFLLLSNSITLRRDKSILYSRATITILLISGFITYENLFFLFLNKGIGIFGGLFSTTATTNVFHMFIFLISSIIFLISLFYRRKSLKRQYSSPDRFLLTTLQSSTNIFVIKVGTICIVTTYADMCNFDSIFSWYHSLYDGFANVINFNLSGRPLHPLIKETYDMWIATKNSSLSIVKPVVKEGISTTSFGFFGFRNELAGLHANLAIYPSMQKSLLCLIGPSHEV